MNLSKDGKRGQFMRFVVNGVAMTCLQYVVYLICILWMNEFVANTIAYAVSFCVNFIVTSYWTFRSRPSWKRFCGFGSSHIVNYCLQQVFLALYLWLGIPKQFAALFAMGSAMPVNFIILHFVYKK